MLTSVNNELSIKISGNGRQTAISRGNPQVKFVDMTQLGFAVLPAGTVLPGLLDVTQGVGVSQRTGDVVFLERLFENYTIYQNNSDIVSTCRIITLQWHPNSALVMPIVTDILKLPAYTQCITGSLAINLV